MRAGEWQSIKWMGVYDRNDSFQAKVWIGGFVLISFCSIVAVECLGDSRYGNNFTRFFNHPHLLGGRS